MGEPCRQLAGHGEVSAGPSAFLHAARLHLQHEVQHILYLGLMHCECMESVLQTGCRFFCSAFVGAACCLLVLILFDLICSGDCCRVQSSHSKGAG